jgi:hypothetical protein
MYSTRMIILLITLVPLTFSFTFFKSKKTRDYEDIANEISAKVAKKLTKKHQMDWIGEGGGMMGSVYMIGLSFEIHHPLDRNEARARIIDCVEELLTAINSNEEIRPFLKNYPFTTHNVQVAIFSDFPDGKEVFDPYITVVSVDENGFITFRTKEPNKTPYKNKYREPYSEALAMVKGKHL